ncbi:hypothetical protein [Streptomyces sp. VRA16 Mangrove soil]|uniref:hypothetical protein n=1 Tax=Streptomyces sp. VRA16 Mangrove soil TaxID=2817434 RepID=UPI001A9D2055|nr:hypothetical protein [Streptomyces sp. VRA16 Mangrove soil]MBO1334722.1 hypothetical protein [Streptomyces sp. VRA16 Mangrove soil]
MLGIRPAAFAERLGLVPYERVSGARTDVVTPEDQQVVRAVRDGDWEAAPRYLAEAGNDWQERDRRALLLGGTDGHLAAWLAARPDDRDMALVRAHRLVTAAWQMRGAHAASHTSEGQFADFHRVLHRAREACHTAQRDAGHDPCPYIAELPVARGLGYSRKDLDALWTEIALRAPTHARAHHQALQYLCAKWHGSHKEAESFARAAAAAGHPGDLLSVLPLTACFERTLGLRPARRRSFYRRRDVVAATDSALVDVAAAQATDPHDPRLPQARHMLAYALHLQGRHDAALEQFRLVDGHAGSLPWSVYPDPAHEFVRARDRSAVRARGI